MVKKVLKVRLLVNQERDGHPDRHRTSDGIGHAYAKHRSVEMIRFFLVTTDATIEYRECVIVFSVWYCFQYVCLWFVNTITLEPFKTSS